jgi:adenosylcobyric acid synthase
VSELNLRQYDLVNLGLVTRIQAPWILVADVERGGVFGSIVGTAHLLTREERTLFRGFAVNKFRGDATLFEEGVRILEEQVASHCFGVFPHAPDVHLDEEDSLALETRARTPAPPGARIAIVRLPHLSNATDFRLLTWADWVTSPPQCAYDFVILPGSKNTISDLGWLRHVGLAAWIMDQHRSGASVIGICGGFQMLGRSVADPMRMESDTTSAAGLGLLPVKTTLAREKRTRAVRATTDWGVTFGAYEIHVGTTTVDPGAEVAPFATLEDGTLDGARSGGVVGTYLHGALEQAEVCAELFGVLPPVSTSKAAHYGRLADWLEQHGRELDRLGFD